MTARRAGAVFSALLLICAAATPFGGQAVAAEEAAAEAAKPWKDQLELSYVQTGGNTRVQTGHLKNDAAYAFTERLTGKWLIELLYGETDGEQSAGHYMTELRLDYNLTEQLFLYGLGGLLKDNFANIDGRYYLGPGAGYHLLVGPVHTLVVEAGLNYNRERYTRTPTTPTAHDDFVMGRLYSKYAYAFTEKSSFSQSMEYLPNLKETIDYLLISETALTAAVNSLLSLKMSYTLKYDQEPAGTAKKTDTIVGAAVVVTL